MVQVSPPLAIWVGTFGIPYLVCLLVLLPHTRPIRIGLWPLGMWALWMLITTIDVAGEPLISLPICELALRWNLGAGFQYAFAHSPPTVILPPSIKSSTIARSIRECTPVRAFDLLFDTCRHISQPPSPSRDTTTTPKPRPARPPRGYFHAIAYHLSLATFHSLISDLTTFSAYYLVSPDHPILGLSQPLGRVFWPISAGLTMYQGTAMCWEVIAALGAMSGLYGDEEWPKVFDAPLRSSSLSEFWGRRYHQLMRRCYTTLALPLKAISPSAHILGVFLISAFYHTALYYPFTHSFSSLIPQLTFWLGAGLGCIQERGYYRLTGKKVEGWTGRIWMWSWMIICAQSLARFEIEYGWMSRAKRMAVEGKGNDHLLNWVLHAFGLPGPLRWYKSNA